MIYARGVKDLLCNPRYDEFLAWYEAGGAEAETTEVGNRSPEVVEFQIWLVRRKFDQYTRCFSSYGIHSMYDLYALMPGALKKLCAGVGFTRKETDKFLSEILVRREVLGYSESDAQEADAQEAERKRQRKRQRKAKKDRRHWRNGLEVASHGPTYRDGKHKPLPCFVLPSPIERMQAAKEVSKGRRAPAAVQTQRRSELAPTLGNGSRSLSPTAHYTATALATSQYSEFGSTAQLSLEGPQTTSLPQIDAARAAAYRAAAAANQVAEATRSSDQYAMTTSLTDLKKSPYKRSPGGGRRRSPKQRLPDIRHETLRSVASVESPTAALDPSSALVPFSEAESGANPAGVPTMQDWIRKSWRTTPEEYFLNGCPDL